MIIVEDHSQVHHSGVWTTSVEITDHRVVEESYVVFRIEITTVTGGKLRIWRRYAEFDALRNELLDELPKEQLSIPPLPPKSSNRGLENAAFLSSRQDGLNYFVKCVLLNPAVARSRAVKRFMSQN